jgi:uncharacterized protein GlcG (DUF336 family)
MPCTPVPASPSPLEGAQVALAAGLARAEELQGRFNVAVTDAAGDLLAFARWTMPLRSPA